MKTSHPLGDAQLGAGTKIDPGVQLNALPGRTIPKPQPTRIGPASHVRSGTMVYASTTIGRSFETGHHVIVREQNTIGANVSIWNNTTIDYGCVIGNRVKIHCNCYVAQFSVLEDDVFLAPGATLANDPFPGSQHAGRILQGPSIGKGAQLGVNCTILPGIRIGKGALIGAGSVVTRNVPDGAVVWGNPARVYKKRTDLIWPASYHIARSDARAFYKKNLMGKPVF